jgi:prepilin-type N-terminal cleavage/methylation domain-containing protein
MLESTEMQLIMNKKFSASNKKGFTLVEVVAVMVIMSVMASLGIKKLDLLSHTAADRVLAQGLRELNTRETLTWTKIKLSDSGWDNDAKVFAELDTKLGHEFTWAVEPNITGGTLRFRSKSIPLSRMPSTSLSVGKWH